MSLLNRVEAAELNWRMCDNQKRPPHAQYSLDIEEIINDMPQYDFLRLISDALGDYLP